LICWLFVSHVGQSVTHLLLCMYIHRQQKVGHSAERIPPPGPTTCVDYFPRYFPDTACVFQTVHTDMQYAGATEYAMHCNGNRILLLLGHCE